MSKDNNKIPLGEALKLNVRGYGIWWKVNPKVFIAITLSSIVDGLSPYVGIYLGAMIISELAGARDKHTLSILVIAALLSAAILSLASAGLRRWRNYHNALQFYELRKIYADKLYSMDFRSVDDQHTQDLLYQIHQNDIMGWYGLRQLVWIYERIANAVVSIVTAAVLIAPLFVLRVPESGGRLTILNNPLFNVGIVAIMLLITMISPMLSTKGSSYWVKFADESKFGNRIHSFYGYSMNGGERALDVRIYRQDKISMKMLEHYIGLGPKSLVAKAGRGPMGALFALSGAVSQVFTGIAYIFVCLKALGGAFGIGSVAQYVGVITSLSSSVGNLMGAFGGFRNNASFLRTTFELLDMPNDMYQGSLPVEKHPDIKYDIEFKNVSFRYPGQNEYALRNISLKFDVGERLAVVGMNGSGKTTFIKLLCRLYDPTEGEILLNGINIRKYNYHEYMSIFPVVFQDFQLVSFSLGQNVAAKVSYDGKKAKSCLYSVGFTQRLEEMTMGLETSLYKDFDEDGIDISGGEAQKIALSRALYKDAQFIILDEPTAALDPIAEAEVYNRMNEIVDGKTAVFISHRLSSCRFCQNIAVFHEGQLIQRGNHDELIADAGGKYNELWNAQAQYYTA